MKHEQFFLQGTRGHPRRLPPATTAGRWLVVVLAAACGSSIAFAGTSSAKTQAKAETSSSAATAAASKVATSKRVAARRKKTAAAQAANRKAKLRDANRNPKLGRTQNLDQLRKVNQGAGQGKLSQRAGTGSSSERLTNPADAFGKHNRFSDGTAGTPKLPAPGGLNTQSHNGTRGTQSQGQDTLGSSSARERKFATAASSRRAQRDPSAIAKEADASHEAIDRGHDQQAENQEAAAETFIRSKEERPALGDDVGSRTDPAAAAERQKRVQDALQHVANGNPGEGGGDDNAAGSLQTVRPTDSKTITNRISQPGLGDDAGAIPRSPTSGKESAVNPRPE